MITLVSYHRAQSTGWALAVKSEHYYCQHCDQPRLGANHVFGWCVNLAGGEEFDRIFLIVLVSLFLGGDQLHVSQLGDRKPLDPDMVGVVPHVALRRVVALSQRIDADPFFAVGQLPITPELANPIPAVDFDVVRTVGVVSEL